VSAPPSAPSAAAASEMADFSLSPDRSTYLARGTVPDAAESQRAALAATAADPNVVGVFSDPAIESTIVCPADPGVRTGAGVAGLLDTKALSQAGLDGQGVMLAIVDTGINLAYIQGKGRTNPLDAANSWTPAGVATTPGTHPVNHGTMCAYDVGIA